MCMGGKEKAVELRISPREAPDYAGHNESNRLPKASILMISTPGELEIAKVIKHEEKKLGRKEKRTGIHHP